MKSVRIMDNRKILSSLSLITQAINSSIKLDQVLKLITLEAVSLMDADICSIMLLDDTRQNLVFCEAFGLTREETRNISFRMGEGVAGYVAESGRPLVVDDVAGDPRFVAKQGQTSSIRSLLCVPLLVKGTTIGVINLTNRERVGAFGSDDKELAILLANHISGNIERFRLYELSITDSLTGAYNHRYFLQSMDKEIMRVRRYGGSLSLAMLDLDHFKQLNDRYGHPAGDEVLRRLVGLVKDRIRQVDVFCRYGGEEFALILPNTGKEGALDIASRIVDGMRDMQIAWHSGGADKVLNVTISAGITTQAADETDRENIILRADRALYLAKSEGRDRVRFLAKNEAG